MCRGSQACVALMLTAGCSPALPGLGLSSASTLTLSALPGKRGWASTTFPFQIHFTSLTR